MIGILFEDFNFRVCEDYVNNEDTKKTKLDASGLFTTYFAMESVFKEGEIAIVRK